MNRYDVQQNLEILKEYADSHVTTVLSARLSTKLADELAVLQDRYDLVVSYINLLEAKVAEANVAYDRLYQHYFHVTK